MFERACFELADIFDILQTVFNQAKGRFSQVLLSGFRPVFDHVDVFNGEMLSFTNSICEQNLKRPQRLGQS